VTDLMTVYEVADKARVSRDFVYSEIKKGNLPHLKAGRIYRITPKQFEDWLSTNPEYPPVNLRNNKRLKGLR